jgi:hypothetical protein
LRSTPCLSNWTWLKNKRINECVSFIPSSLQTFSESFLPDSFIQHLISFANTGVESRRIEIDGFQSEGSRRPSWKE